MILRQVILCGINDPHHPTTVIPRIHFRHCEFHRQQVNRGNLNKYPTAIRASSLSFQPRQRTNPSLFSLCKGRWLTCSITSNHWEGFLVLIHLFIPIFFSFYPLSRLRADLLSLKRKEGYSKIAFSGWRDFGLTDAGQLPEQARERGRERESCWVGFLRLSRVVLTAGFLRVNSASFWAWPPDICRNSTVKVRSSRFFDIIWFPRKTTRDSRLLSWCGNRVFSWPGFLSHPYPF